MPPQVIGYAIIGWLLATSYDGHWLMADIGWAGYDGDAVGWLVSCYVAI